MVSLCGERPTGRGVCLSVCSFMPRKVPFFLFLRFFVVVVYLFDSQRSQGKELLVKDTMIIGC